MLYPINLNLKNKKCLVVGGGSVAERKILSLLEAKAKITVISPRLTDAINDFARNEKIIWKNSFYKSGQAKGYFLVVVATDDIEVNNRAIYEAKSFGALVNAPANPELSDFTVPAVTRRGNLTIAVSTEGISPAFSGILKEEISDFLPKNIEVWLEVLKNLRSEIKEKLKTSKEREKFWRKALNKQIFGLLKAGKLKEAEVELKNVFSGDWTKP